MAPIQIFRLGFWIWEFIWILDLEVWILHVFVLWCLGGEKTPRIKELIEIYRLTEFPA